jgi:hypothetical protein
MTLIIEKPTGAKLNLRKTWQPMDPDAAAYITAVETADTEPLEERTKIAIDNFVLGCKADGIWSAIKASCILAGARTLTGALVPLVGTAPTNVGGLFVSGDYNRKTGLVGNGSTKYLNSNRADNVSPQNSNHASVYSTTAPTVSGNLIGGGGDISLVQAFTQIFSSSTFAIGPRNHDLGSASFGSSGLVGFGGHSRNSSASYQLRFNGSNTPVTESSLAPTANNLFVFARNNNGTVGNYTNARLAFYSIGESLDLALLDARVTDLITAFAAAIP